MKVGSFMLFLLLMVFGLVLLVSTPKEKSIMSESALKIVKIVEGRVRIWWDKYTGPDDFYIEPIADAECDEVVNVSEGEPDIFED